MKIAHFGSHFFLIFRLNVIFSQCEIITMGFTWNSGIVCEIFLKRCHLFNNPLLSLLTAMSSSRSDEVGVTHLVRSFKQPWNAFKTLKLIEWLRCLSNVSCLFGVHQGYFKKVVRFWKGCFKSFIRVVLRFFHRNFQRGPKKVLSLFQGSYSVILFLHDTHRSYDSLRQLAKIE